FCRCSPSFAFVLLVCLLSSFFFSLVRHLPISTLFPYTTLFRSQRALGSWLRLALQALPRLLRRAAVRQGRVRDDHGRCVRRRPVDRKSTRLNSSHGSISYAVFCLKKKKKSTCNTNRSLAKRHAA